MGKKKEEGEWEDVYMGGGGVLDLGWLGGCVYGGVGRWDVVDLCMGWG